MESTCGYVYVMINPSYGEDVVKIGKTTKEPEERAKELSAATGVATPFIVAYKRLFKNCHYAEKLIHQILEEKGCRVNTNREFFSISAPDAINVILQIPDEQDGDSNYSDGCDTEEPNADLAEEYYAIAYKYEHGSDDTFRDINKAIIYYEKSAILGNAKASYQLGWLWYYRKRCAEKALYFFHQAANNGHWQSFANIALIYEQDLTCRDRINARLAWGKYFGYISTHHLTQEDWDGNNIGDNFIQYILWCGLNNNTILEVADELARKNKETIKFALNEKADNLYKTGSDILALTYKQYVGQYIDELY